MYLLLYEFEIMIQYQITFIGDKGSLPLCNGGTNTLIQMLLFKSVIVNNWYVCNIVSRKLKTTTSTKVTNNF